MTTADCESALGDVADPGIAGTTCLFEPAFVEIPCGSLAARIEPHLRVVWIRHLGFRIARNPSDLTAHVQRVLAAHAQQDAEGTYCALLDLHTALAGKGGALRESLLRRADRLIGPDRVRRLRDLPRGVPDRREIERAGACRLRAAAEPTSGTAQ